MAFMTTLLSENAAKKRIDVWWFTYTDELETQRLKYCSSYSPVSFSLPDKPILRTVTLSLITVVEASEATTDHCLVKLHIYISCKLLLGKSLNAWHLSRFLLVSDYALTVGFVTAIHHFLQNNIKPHLNAVATLSFRSQNWPSYLCYLKLQLYHNCFHYIWFSLLILLSVQLRILNPGLQMLLLCPWG